MLNLRTLGKYTATPGNGCTRLPFTEDAYDAKEFIRFLMCDAGLKAHDDGAGNLFGVKKGKNPDLPCIMMGSHYDSVINGGNYDGIAGVVCALEVARILNEEGIELEQIGGKSARYIKFVGAGNSNNGHSNILEFRVLQKK